MANDSVYERELASLVNGNNPENRKLHALQAKREGKKVIGLLCSYAPEEIIYAAGMLPWRVTGTWDGDLSRAAAFRELDSCRYCTHALEALLRGDLDFLDGVVGSDWDDDRRRLIDVWIYASRPGFSATYTAPKSNSEISEKYFGREISQLLSSLETFSAAKVTEEKLWHAIRVYNKTRSLLMQLYELRKRPEPPVTGAEVLGITTTSQVMEKESFNAKLEALLPYVEKRRTGHKENEPRILLSSDMLDNPRFLDIIEKEGCIIAMDDLDTGSRYFHRLVDQNARDPIRAIARRYCWRPADPTAFNWEEQVAKVIEWAREWRADGVIDLYEEFSQPRQWRAPLMARELNRVGIPLMRIGRVYQVGGVEQLRTRTAAFLEMLPVPL